MSQIAELTASIQQKSQQIAEATQTAVESELTKLRNATQMHCESVQNELRAATDEIESLCKTTTAAVQNSESEIKKKITEATDSVTKAVKDSKERMAKSAETLDTEIKALEADMKRRFAKMSLWFTVALSGVIGLMVAVAAAVTEFYIKPDTLMLELQQRQKLERSGLLVRGANGTFIVLPDGTNCTWTVGKKKACRLPDPPLLAPQK